MDIKPRPIAAVDILSLKTQMPVLTQAMIRPDFWSTPNVAKGGNAYLGGLINYNPPQGQTGADRLGLFGSALRDAAALYQGRPQFAGSLEQMIAEQRRRAQLLHEQAMAGRRQRRAGQVSG